MTGYEKTGRRVWVEFRPTAPLGEFVTKRRYVYVGDDGAEYVLDRDGKRFERLAYGDSIIGWGLVGSLRPTPPRRWFKKGGAR